MKVIPSPKIFKSATYISKAIFVHIYHNNYKNSFIIFVNNNLIHNTTSPGIIYLDGDMVYYYKGGNYGYKNDFTNETWKKKVKELKRKEKLRIFK